MKFDFISMDSPVFNEIAAYVEANKEALKEFTDSLDVDYETYRQAAEAGQFMALTLRHDGRLVGFSLFHLSPDPRSRHNVDAENHGLFVEEAFRAKYGSRMITEASKYLDRLGIRETDFRNDNEAFGRMLAKFGFKKKTTIWSRKNG